MPSVRSAEERKKEKRDESVSKSRWIEVKSVGNNQLCSGKYLGKIRCEGTCRSDVGVVWFAFEGGA
eukprot:1694470-Rhodomonas_salina.1